MSHVTVVWSVIAACALLLAVMYGLVWAMDRRQRASLAFAFECLAVVGTVVAELNMMHAETPAEWGELVRWIQIPVLVRTIALAAFIRFYFETGRSWLIWLVIGSRAVVAIGSFLVDPNFNFSSIESLDRMTFLGEQVSIIGHAVVSPYQWFSTVSAYLVPIFVLDASISLWRKGDRDARRKVLVIGGAALLAWLLGATYTQLMVYGAARLPPLLSPPYLIMLAAMTIELSRDTLRAARLARELRDSEARLGLAASAAGLGLWTWDAPRNRIWATRSAHRMLGFPGEGFVDVESVRLRIHPDDLQLVERAWREGAASSEEVEVQFRVRLPDGMTRWIAAHGRATADDRGGLSSGQGVLRDVTETHRAREENEELRRELAHAGRVSVLGTLSSSLTHELGQPLAAILLNAESAELLLQRPNPDLAEVKQILADIRRDDSRAAEVIDRLRKLLKRGQMDVAPVSAEALVQDIAAVLKQDAIARHVALEIRSEPNLPMIRGDRVHLSQVLINLVVNGMDAVADLPPAQRRVVVQARGNGPGSVELTVADSGSGVDPAAMNRIFEPFFTTKTTGMGMGLSVSRTIVEAHDGKIWVEAAPDRGAIFRVTLPVVS